MTGAVGQPLNRVDGPAKVTGSATYAGEFAVPDLCHAVLVGSPIPAGRVHEINIGHAEKVAGVLAVITHENAPALPYTPREQSTPVDPDSGEQLRVFQSPDVLFSDQPLAVVVAESLEAADHAAQLITVSYDQATPDTTFGIDRARPPRGRNGERGRGDVDAGLAEAGVTIQTTCDHAREHHNAIEPHATIAKWDGGRLTLYDKSQWVDNVRAEIAHVFGMEEKDVRTISPFVGGAFGSSLRVWPHVTVAALAARVVGRPVRLELSRRELYSAIGYRPETRQRVTLGADTEGHLTAIVHEATGQTSKYEDYTENTLKPSLNSYACPNVLTRYRLVEMNVSTPCPMRAPGIISGLLALETAMDELAHTLDLDPVELRLRNYAETDQASGLPWSSKALRECYATAADAFGWDRRASRPGTMRQGDELVGYGMATTTYAAHQAPASASVTLFANGSARVRSAASDMGPGTYTSVTQVAAEALGLPAERVRFELGDTELPEAPVHGGSITMASIGSAAAAACEALRNELAARATATDGPFAGASPEEVEWRPGGLGLKGDGEALELADLLRRAGQDSLTTEASAAPGESARRVSSAAFGAVFAEVRVDADLGTVRVPRVVGAYDAGRIINPKTARSQIIGGMVGGIGMALMEEAEWDPRFGRVMNANLAEYLVPVCADAGDLEVHFVGKPDYAFNPIGAKGLAEVAICGVAPAIGNAVYNATGRRVERFPIMPEDLL